MNLARFLAEDRVDLALDEAFDEEHPVTSESLATRMATLLQRSPDIGNPKKLTLDLINREKQAPSLLGSGVALPHVRTMQARKLIMAIGIAHHGLDIPTPDGEPVRLVVAFVGPPYDDRNYLLAYKRLGEKLEEPGWIDEIVASSVPGEVLRALSR